MPLVKVASVKVIPQHRSMTTMSDIIETIQYRRHTINVHHDSDASNPWKEWDGQPPMIVLHGGRRAEFTEYGLDLSVPTFTKEQMKASLPALKKALGITGRILPFCQEYAVSQRYNYTGAVDLFNDAISEYFEQQSSSDKMELLADLYQAIGVPALRKSVHGSSQGDYAEVLLVATPEWVKEVGIAPERIEQSLKSDAELYGNWAFGNCYGYTIEEIDEAGCWGFYGYNHEESGLLDAAKSDIDYHIEQARKAHTKQVKTWIRNRVPYQYRSIAA